jgi:hypothetical protein
LEITTPPLEAVGEGGTVTGVPDGLVGDVLGGLVVDAPGFVVGVVPVVTPGAVPKKGPITRPAGTAAAVTSTRLRMIDISPPLLSGQKSSRPSRLPGDK